MDERRPLPRSAVRRSTHRDLHAVADVQTHRPRERELPEDAGVASDRAALDPVTDALDLGAVGHRRPFDLRPLDHHITPIEELTEQGPIRLEQIGCVATLRVRGSTGAGGSRHQSARRAEPRASRSPDRLRLTAAWSSHSR
jgi:hypothetical protein